MSAGLKSSNHHIPPEGCAPSSVSSLRLSPGFFERLLTFFYPRVVRHDSCLQLKQSKH